MIALTNETMNIFLQSSKHRRDNSVRPAGTMVYNSRILHVHHCQCLDCNPQKKSSLLNY